MVGRKLLLLLSVIIFTGCSIIQAEKAPVCNVDYVRDIQTNYLCVRRVMENNDWDMGEFCNESLNEVLYKLEFNRSSNSVAYKQIDDLKSIQVKTLRYLSRGKTGSIAMAMRESLNSSYIDVFKTERVGGCAHAY